MHYSEETLRKKILSDKYNKVIFSSGNNYDIYIVGGYVRDILLHRKSLDRDYVVKGTFMSLLNRVAFETSGKIVSLGRKGLHRIIVNNNVTLDFLPLKYNIECDIAERDFTINALAWSPKRGIIDIEGGRKDLSKKLIRMTAIENLKADPVRILRAYRFAEELSFGIDPETRNALRTLGGMIKQTKSERITLEFFKILNSTEPSGTLKTLLRDNVLGHIIYINYNELEDRLQVISKINKICDELPLRYRSMLHERFSQNLILKGLMRLEVLLEDIPEHILSFSSHITKRLMLMQKAEAFMCKRKVTRRLLFDLFALTENAAIDFLLKRNILKYIEDYERYLKIKKRGLLSCGQIMRIADIYDGPVLGRLLNIVKRAEFDEKVKTKQEAIDLLKKCQKSYVG
jgi:tRNA nucleotidyltransferase/poly(A) polymerase